MNENILSYVMGGIGITVGLLIGILIFSQVSTTIDEAKITCEQTGVDCREPSNPMFLLVIPIATIIMLVIAFHTNGSIDLKKILLKTGLVKLKNE